MYTVALNGLNMELLAPRILRWLLDFWKIRALLFLCVTEFKVECEQDSSATRFVPAVNALGSQWGRQDARARIWKTCVLFLYERTLVRLRGTEVFLRFSVGHFVRKCSAFEESHHVHVIVLLDSIHSQMNLIYTTTIYLTPITY